jgi:hypothetical protein
VVTGERHIILALNLFLLKDHSISQVVNGKEMFWHLDNEGGKVRASPLIARGSLFNLAQVRIAPSSHGIQSWVFKATS